MRNRKLLRLKAAVVLGLLCSAAIPSEANNDLAEARSAVSEWVKVEKLISEERSDWDAERVIISDMISLLAQEKSKLIERIELAKTATSEADKKRATFISQREEFIEAMTFLGEQVGRLEGKIKELHVKFPPPLQDEVSVSYNRIPDDGVKSRLSVSQRLQTIVVVLSQADKFNGGVQVVSKIQELESGPAEVDILYFGLAGAYFKDKTGKYVGVGYPDASGWSWKETPESAAAISDLFDVYQGSSEAEFIKLPVSIK